MLLSHPRPIRFAVAGIYGGPFMTSFDEPLSLDKDPPAQRSEPIDVNLTGLLYTAKAAQLYLTYPPTGEAGTKTATKNPVFFGSLGGHMEITWMANYNASNRYLSS
jgi:hypothetical protein